MTYKDKLQHLKEHLLERHSNLTDYVENLTGDVKEVVELLLEADSNYEVFKVHSSFEDYETLIREVVHALTDDGEMVVERTYNEGVNRVRQKISERIGKPFSTYYNYRIVFGDSIEPAKRVTADQLKRLLLTVNPPVEYYEKFGSLIEDRSLGFTNEYRKTYGILSSMTNKMFEEIYKENQYDN